MKRPRPTSVILDTENTTVIYDPPTQEVSLVTWSQDILGGTWVWHVHYCGQALMALTISNTVMVGDFDV